MTRTIALPAEGRGLHPPGPNWGSPEREIPIFNIGTIRDRMGTR